MCARLMLLSLPSNPHQEDEAFKGYIHGLPLYFKSGESATDEFNCRIIICTLGRDECTARKRVARFRNGDVNIKAFVRMKRPTYVKNELLQPLRSQTHAKPRVNGHKA